MTDFWTTVGKRWADRVAELVGDLKHHNENLWTQVGQDHNELFPLRAWASLSRDAAPNEDVAISLDFRFVPGGVEYRSDIAHGDGLILAETPTQTIERSDDLATFEESVWNAMDSVDAFLKDHQDLLIAELS
jgi:hypothetical protein